MANAIIIHTDEIALKGGNRAFFERLLVENIKSRLVNFGDFDLKRRKGSVVIRFQPELDQSKAGKIVTALKTVFGIAHLSLTHECSSNLTAIKEMAVKLTADLTGTFRLTCKRGEKRFPHSSMEVARQVGGAVLAANRNLKVDLHQPDQTVFVEINVDGTFISLAREPGPGGLPIGSTGKVVALLSGGIDSPVAAYQMMRRGARAIFVHFHSYPYVGQESIEKVKRLAKIIDQYQLQSKLYLVPFADIQREITAKTDGALRVVLYRRFMLRIAEVLAKREGALGIVTGDSLGQVASQTLENLYTVGSVLNLPLYRPLVGTDKREIVKAAQKISSYETSIEPHDDCCTLFVPDHPELRATPEQASAAETKLDVTGLITEALQHLEVMKINAES
ncbi:tRNA 4-thiouridine(8) synthase ThiI [Patescibacteria group bacterium]|nr:tRNA 4-thiouridine(8) synthase ThiI [Patescibacteria group bacterium]MBU1028816.1 tRNA 4-thiouridine(8) synthase ThiI [Patescibacteria group bacterium]MBU1915782.1 tRNA 4-thiouridine(8) synthase ThiI [Patescibacteria group bacterium]